MVITFISDTVLLCTMYVVFHTAENGSKRTVNILYTLCYHHNLIVIIWRRISLKYVIAWTTKYFSPFLISYTHFSHFDIWLYKHRENCKLQQFWIDHIIFLVLILQYDIFHERPHEFCVYFPAIEIFFTITQAYQMTLLTGLYWSRAVNFAT